jgi:7,8-dihydropterin-6-yl-methyl-4-(beta-D-ribofuranosyl)aminobenzene 5'-phosphate synthase
VRRTYLLVLLLLAGAAGAAERHQVKALKITILSTMLAEAEELGEWGFAALVEVDGHRLLFDTGARPDTVLQNVRSMHIDLAGIDDVILSHNHGDHTGGLVRLRKEYPQALGRAHVAPAIFWARRSGWMTQVKKEYEELGGRFAIHDGPAEIFPGVWFTGPVPRTFPERNFPPGGVVQRPDGKDVDDDIPEDSSLVFDTADGLVVLSGCGHAGVVNTATYARKIVRPARIAALIGGFHLFAADDAKLEWTGTKLREIGVGSFIGAHCTGIESTWQLRRLLGLTRKTAIVGAVRSSYTLGKGVDAGGMGLAR